MLIIEKYKNTSSYFRLLVEHGVVLAVGLLVFWVDDQEFFRYLYPKLFVVLWATVKAVFFLWDTLRRILSFLRENYDFMHFVQFVGISVLLIVLSFAIDYWCMYQVEAASFKGIVVEQHVGLQYLNFLYYSVCTFVTVGYGDIVPTTFAAKYLAMLEMCLSFITIILVISNFSNFKEAMQK